MEDLAPNLFRETPHRMFVPTLDLAPGSLSDEVDGPTFDILHHGIHAGCCLTPAFQTVVGSAPVAVVVVGPEGHFIYANPAAEALLGYPVAQLMQKHITEVVEAAPTWVASEFEHLVQHEHWSGRVLLRRLTDELLKVTVNAYSSPLPESGAEHIAFLDPTFLNGPAIDRLPDSSLGLGLTVQHFRLLHLIAAGFSDAEVADIVGTTDSAVKEDVAALLEEMDVSSKAEAVVIGVRKGLIV